MSNFFLLARCMTRSMQGHPATKKPCLPPLRLRPFLLRVKMVQKKMRRISHPAHQLQSASRPVKRKVASGSRNRSTSTRPVSRWVSKATPPPGDDSEDMWHSPGDPDTEPQALKFSPSILQDPGLTRLKHGHRSACSNFFF
ncbi:hypothetical protein ILYODFUR_037664 [Ilyodon furcidens]|uniref:Uncharacterized protein n=1 Tax=Ilyodon furcidens TaxID=33524 RepID=A0ABV0TEE6_9TELE